MGVAVFHHISDEKKDFHNTIEEILAFDGVITFDGAYRSVYVHRQALKDREPILFIQGNTVGTEGVCSQKEIAELVDMGFVLGWHGWTHRRLTELPDHVVINELNPPTDSYKLYAYPHGEWDDRVAKLVKEMGYFRAYSTTQGVEGNDFAIPREYL